MPSSVAAIGRRLLIAFTAAASIVASGSASVRADPVWHPYHGSGFTISLPADWHVVPLNRAAIPALAQKLRQQGKNALAALYMSTYSDRYQWDQPQLFHAFEWPLPFPGVLTDMVLRGSGIPPSLPPSDGALRAIATATVSELRKRAGADEKVAAPVRVAFPDGLTSYRIEMRVTLDKSYAAKASYTILYLFFGRAKARYYQLFVRGEAGLGSQYRKTADEIAARFRPD